MGFESDHSFIQDEEHRRPKPTISEAGSIPIIDLSQLIAAGDAWPQDALSALVAEVGSACKDWGFFQVINHGVSDELIESIQAVAREFFALPLEEKRRVRRGEGMENPLGYYDAESTKNVRDWKEVFDFAGDGWTVIPVSERHGDERTVVFWNQWPEYPPEFRGTCEEFTGRVEKLAHQLLELISLSLGLPASHLIAFFKDNMNFFRMNHYPPCPEPQLALGLEQNLEGGVLTILLQDEVGGLDVCRKSDGEWVYVKPIPNSFIINVGDIVRVWSNDAYMCVEHRVSVTPRGTGSHSPFSSTRCITSTSSRWWSLPAVISRPSTRSTTGGSYIRPRGNMA